MPSFLFIYLILKSLILTCVPRHEPLSHFPPHNISLGHPHAPAPSMLYPASDRLYAIFLKLRSFLQYCLAGRMLFGFLVPYTEVLPTGIFSLLKFYLVALFVCFFSFGIVGFFFFFFVVHLIDYALFSLVHA